MINEKQKILATINEIIQLKKFKIKEQKLFSNPLFKLDEIFINANKPKIIHVIFTNIIFLPFPFILI